jgi:hypothetical protein
MKDQNSSGVKIVVAVSLLAILAWLSIRNSDQSSAPSPAVKGPYVTDPKSESLEYQLAYLDAGTMKLDREDVSVKRIKFLLDELATTTKEGRQQIADQTTQAVSVARDKYGLPLTHLRLLEEMRGFFSARPPKVKTTYREATLLYLIANK